MRTGSTFELQIQGARPSAQSRDDPGRSVGGSGARRGAGVQLNSHDRSGQVSPYLNSLSYGSHELVGGRRSAAATSASPSGSSKNLAAGASAAVQEAHQRLERLLGPQQPATGAAGIMKRPISAPLTFGAPIGTGAGSGGNGSGGVLGANSPGAPYASSIPVNGSTTSSRPRPASASPLQASGKGASGGSVSLLSTAPAAMGASPSSAASNHRASPGRRLSALEPSGGMISSVGVTGVISSGHNNAAGSVGEGNGSVGASKGRLRSPTGGLNSTKEGQGLADRNALGPGSVLLDGSASMPTLLPSSLDSSPSSASGAGVAFGRRGAGNSPASALTASASEKVLGSSRSPASSVSRSPGMSALRNAPPSSASPKSGVVASGSASQGSGLGTAGASKSQSLSRRRVSTNDPAGSSSGAGSSPTTTADGGNGRTGTAAGGNSTTALKAGHVVSTSRVSSGNGGTASQSGQVQRIGGTSGSSEGVRVRTVGISNDRHPSGPRSPASPSGPAAGSTGAKTATARPGSSGSGGSSGKAVGSKSASSRRASTGQQEMGGSTGLAGELILTSAQGVRASGTAAGVGSNSSGSNSVQSNTGSAGGRPSSSERRRRSSSNTTNTTATNRSPTEGAAGVPGVGFSPGPGAVRDSAARQNSSSSSISLATTSGTAAQGGSGHRIKPPSIDLSALVSVPATSAASDTSPFLNRQEVGKGGGGGGGRRAAGAELSGSLETRLGPPVSPILASPPGSRYSASHGLEDAIAPPPLLLLPTRSPLQSPRSALGLPRRTRGGLGSGSGGALTCNFGGLPVACRWARNAPVPVNPAGAIAMGSEMPASAVVMHDLQVSAHNLLLQLGVGTTSFIDILRERYVELYRANRKVH